MQVDPKDEKLIDEFADLTKEIEKVSEQLTLLKNRYKEVDQQLQPLLTLMESTEERMIKTEKSVLYIKRRGYERTDKKYKEAFTLALTKVNEATKRILNEALDKTKTITNIATSIAARKRQADESIQLENKIQKALAKFKTWVVSQVKRLLSLRKDLFNKLDVLDKLIIGK